MPNMSLVKTKGGVKSVFALVPENGSTIRTCTDVMRRLVTSPPAHDRTKQYEPLADDYSYFVGFGAGR